MTINDVAVGMTEATQDFDLTATEIRRAARAGDIASAKLGARTVYSREDLGARVQRGQLVGRVQRKKVAANA